MTDTATDIDTDTDKLAAIRAILEDLGKLQRHFIKTNQFSALANADAGALKRIAAIVDCPYY